MQGLGRAALDDTETDIHHRRRHRLSPAARQQQLRRPGADAGAVDLHHGQRRAQVRDPAIRPKLLEAGFEIVANTPEQFSVLQAGEFARWKKVIEVGKISAD